jgi:hypothetical protein
MFNTRKVAFVAIMEELIGSEYDFHNTPSKTSAATDKEKCKCIMDCNTPSSMV